ncbi:MAG: 2-hydroxyacyl-CoA dehydratase [Deltaproteobacteria bacterium]|nr:2-hydroxyacyl-CoA dehydratase [Deltaproteobacteria bacterium]
MESARNTLLRLKSEGRKIIGCFPLYPPLELLHSMGLVPVVLWGLSDGVRATPDADGRIQNYACSVARRLAQFVMAEGKDLLDGLFFYNACDTLRNLPEILLEGVAESGAAPLPMFRMHVPMTPPAQADSSEYLRNEVRNLIASLEKHSGLEFSEERFARSAELYSSMRNLCRLLEAAVAERRLGFADFCETLSSANFLPVEDQIALLKSRLASLPPDPAPKNFAGRVIVSGILPPPLAVCRLMDQAGLLVAGNDVASLFRSYAVAPSDWKDAADYYVRFYQGHFPCTTLLNLAERRMEAVMALALEKGADGFVFVGEKFCEYEYFEIPDMENLLRKNGLATLAIEISLDDEDNVEAYRTRMEAFSEVLLERNRPKKPEGVRS